MRCSAQCDEVSMPTLKLFKNFRKDGGVRIGISTGHDVFFHAFIPGELPENPALEWYFDLICEGRSVPAPGDRLEESRRWFLDNVSILQKAVGELADRLEFGIDGNGEPFRLEKRNVGPIAKLVVQGSANRGIRDTDLRERLKEFADQLPADLESLTMEVVGQW
jgi:hypothetical protein